jgi:uncharacterized membrane protein YcaP (DUF421 family)
MGFFDFVVAITLGSLTANMAMGTHKTTYSAAILIALFAILDIVTALLQLKSKPFEKLVSSEPVVLVSRGEIVKANLGKLRLTLHKMNSLLREKDAFNIADVEYAILETTGMVSVLLKSDKKPLTPADMSITKPPSGLTVDLILDGEIQNENLMAAGKDVTWLLRELSDKGYSGVNVKDIFFAALDPTGTLYVSLGKPGNKEQHGQYGIE